jgi:hypothetical protein
MRLQLLLGLAALGASSTSAFLLPSLPTAASQYGGGSSLLPKPLPSTVPSGARVSLFLPPLDWLIDRSVNC